MGKSDGLLSWPLAEPGGFPRCSVQYHEINKLLPESMLDLITGKNPINTNVSGQVQHVQELIRVLHTILG